MKPRFLAAKGYDVQFGARPLKRAIQNYLEDGLSELIVSADYSPVIRLMFLSIRKKTSWV